MKCPICLLFIPLFTILLFTSCYQDPGPYAGKWHCYNIWPFTDPIGIIHPEFHNNGTVTLTPAGNHPAQTFNFSYSNDSLFIDDGSTTLIYKTYFPHQDTMQWTPDSASWGTGWVPTFYFYRI